MMDRHPPLYLIARDHNSTVKNYMEIRHGQFYWNPLFISVVQDWESEEVTQILGDLIYSSKIKVGYRDRLVWVPSSQNEFQVKSYYKVLRGSGPQFP